MGLLPVIVRRRHWLAALWVVVAMLVGSCSDAGPVPVPLTPVILPSGPIPPGPRFLTPTPAPSPTPEPIVLEGPLTVAVSGELPEEMALPLMVALNQIDRVQAANGLYPVQLLDQVDNADTVIDAVPWPVADAALAQRVFAVVEPFATPADDIPLDDLRLRWQGQGDGPVFASGPTAQLLTPILGEAAAPAIASNAAAAGCLLRLFLARFDPRQDRALARRRTMRQRRLFERLLAGVTRGDDAGCRRRHCRGRCSRSSCTRRASRACTCAWAGWRVAACAGRTAGRIFAPKSSG